MSVSPRKLAAIRRNLMKAGKLTEAGRQRLRESAQRNRPWEKSTGPKSTKGKMVSRLNSLKHGGRDAHSRAFKTWFFAACRVARMELIVLGYCVPGGRKRRPSTWVRYRASLHDYLIAFRRATHSLPRDGNTTDFTNWLTEDARLVTGAVENGQIPFNTLVEPRPLVQSPSAIAQRRRRRARRKAKCPWLG